jgi:hypothetical protein
MLDITIFQSVLIFLYGPKDLSMELMYYVQQVIFHSGGDHHFAIMLHLRPSHVDPSRAKHGPGN